MARSFEAKRSGRRTGDAPEPRAQAAKTAKASAKSGVRCGATGKR